jgi:Asp/Glu/hydantoin racemase
MNDTLVLVHTVSPLLAVFDALAEELLPGVRLMHVLDEPLLEQVRQRGHLAVEDSARLQAHVKLAEQVGAQVVLVTCSTISPCVDDIAPDARIPLFKIDAAMIVQAGAQGTRIGVVATNETTLEPTRQLLQAQADACGKAIEIELVLVEHALPALLAGDGETHDRLVKEATLVLAGHVDVVVLAQASMARVLNVISETERAIPLLTSPHLALGRIKKLLTSA